MPDYHSAVEDNRAGEALYNECDVVRERQRAAVQALSASTRLYNPAIAAHGQSTGVLVARMARDAGLGEDLAFASEMCAYIHDIGLNGVDPRILDKEEQLVGHEVNIIRLHPYRSASILEQIPYLSAWAPIVRSHHERVDGKGYPDGLYGAEIPLESRLLAVADAFISMTSVHTWRGIVSPFAAILELNRETGSQFDEDAVQALTRTLNIRQSADIALAE